MIIVPKETENNVFDIRRDMIGTGPFMLDNYVPSVGFTLKRNPDYWDQNAALVDQINYPIVIDNSQAEAQLRAGNIHAFYANLRAGEPLRAQEGRAAAQHLPARHDGRRDGHDLRRTCRKRTTRLRDERVRQAFSMSMDREAWIDAFYNVSNFEKDGLPVETRWNSALPLDFTGYWLDPQGKDFGPNAKYYQHNIDEAKKLMAAAGFGSGLTIKSNRITTNAIGDLYRHAEAMEGMALDAGFKIAVNAVDYGTDYIPKIRDANGQYDGIAFHSVTGTTPWRLHPISALAAEYWSKAGVTFKGFSTTGKNDKAGDPAVDAIIEKARLEKDINKQKAYAAGPAAHAGQVHVRHDRSRSCDAPSPSPGPPCATSRRTVRPPARRLGRTTVSGWTRRNHRSPTHREQSQGRGFPGLVHLKEAIMADNYWSQVLNNRIGRRRAIAGDRGDGAGRCLPRCLRWQRQRQRRSGSSSKDVEQPRRQAEDTTKDAKRGGILKDRNTADPPTYDAHQADRAAELPGAARLQHPGCGQARLPGSREVRAAGRHRRVVGAVA